MVRVYECIMPYAYATHSMHINNNLKHHTWTKHLSQFQEERSIHFLEVVGSVGQSL